jgi:hopanoid biosynthesis associated RND transporter like protein HpnN
MLGSKALLFVSDKDLADLSKTLKDFRPFIAQFTRTTNLVSLFNMVCAQFRTAKQEANAENDALVKALPALERIVSQATDSLHRQGTPPSPGITALFDPGEEAEQQMYITFAKGRIYLVTTQAPTEDLNGAAVARLRQLVTETKTEVPGLNVGLTGEPVLELDEMTQSQKDTTVAAIVSLVLCALIFIYGYQETGRPVKATACLLIGLGYTLAFATLVIGHLNILTITFMPILIGLAIDYGVHLISRYEEELRRGLSKEAALTKAMVFTGQGIFTGGFTTAGGFLAMGLTNFKGIQEMGIICGGGLLVCMVPMMTMLPVLLIRGRQNVEDQEPGDALAEKRARIENLWLRRPGWTAGVTLALCALAATQLHKVYFDYDLLNMQSKGLPAVEFEKELIDSTPKGVLFGAVVATNLQQAAVLEQQLTNLPAVASVDSITSFLSEDQTRKLTLVDEIKKELCTVRFAAPDPKPVNLQELSGTLYSLRGYLGAALDDVQKDAPELVPQFNALRDAIEALRREMLLGDTNQVEANSVKLAEFQRSLFDDVHDTFQALSTQDSRGPLSVADLPPALRDRFVGVTGKYLLMVYPKEDIWKRENQKVFIDQVGKLYPNVTGTPVQLYHYTALLKDSYQQAAWYSLGAIALLVFLHFRSVACVVLALVPVAIGSLWLGGLMGWLGVPLNPANIMTLPLVIGIGVTNGIHILNRFAEEQTPSLLARSTGKAVLVSGLTAMAGFGSLILAQHQGIHSLGCVMTTGLATCMIAGLTFLPALLNLLMRSRVTTEQPSADNARSTLGREEPR